MGMGFLEDLGGGGDGLEGVELRDWVLVESKQRRSWSCEGLWHRVSMGIGQWVYMGFGRNYWNVCMIS